MEINIEVPENIAQIEDLGYVLNGLQQALAPFLEVMEQMAALLEARRKVDDGYDKINQVLGREMGDLWEQPSSQNPYILGWQVEFEDDIWVSDSPANVWKPGEAGWHKKYPDIDSDILLPWDKDFHYVVGAKCTRDGHIWECKIEHGAAYAGTWGPSAATHAVWDDLGPIEESRTNRRVRKEAT